MISLMPATRLLALHRDEQLSPVEVIEQTLRRLEQACRAYEAAAGPVWPSPELSRCLDKIARPADTRQGQDTVEPELMKEEEMANKEQKRKTREAKKPKQKKKESPKEPASKVQQVTRS
jgi:hypothetical protein